MLQLQKTYCEILKIAISKQGHQRTNSTIGSHTVFINVGMRSLQGAFIKLQMETIVNIYFKTSIFFALDRKDRVKVKKIYKLLNYEGLCKGEQCYSSNVVNSVQIFMHITHLHKPMRVRIERDVSKKQAIMWTNFPK